ncbi:DUF4832 domain-containing protein [Aporhodopirellula aestuarii]|uniref:DUF4832 domain-containing protein n=1 Tax=Aporhodopirellula aestuarii TaxID=2950107 RepID=A0ABT0U8B0_9BACT|nr:DUF4832 domain-containing protein [Aporhodopirellula aestuarii]MCM2373175.1 DUF4832 domain-containing protein [Aporhodopirellula aestuarii]
MTGIVLWTDNPKVDTRAVQLEFRYCGYDEVVRPDGVYDYSLIESVLDAAASRNHQAVLRFYFVYPSKKTTVPDHIRLRSDYRETIAKSEGKTTHFCDWSNAALKQFTLEFYENFASRYDRDPRIAYLETGFGLWAEYHIYDGPRKLGATFPDESFQSKFLKHLQSSFENLPWMISIDASDPRYSPIKDDAELLSLGFGVFDDSFLCKQHAEENEIDWKILNSDRWRRAPGGGEFSYYNSRDQKFALAPQGPNGVSFESDARKFHITFMIGNDQVKFQSEERIKAAGMATGYRLRITEAVRVGDRVRLEVTNDGVAPLYRDAYFSIAGSRSTQTLKELLPGESISIELMDPDRVAENALTVECDHILPGQKIQFAADLD